MAPTAPTKPFPGEYDHITKDADDNHFEMTCRACRGNCSPHAPYPFIDPENGINTHFSTIHGDAEDPVASEGEDVDDDGELIAKIEGNVYFRKLTLGDVHLIEAGKGEQVIKKKTLATKSNPAKITKRPTNMTLKDYPTVVEMADGSFKQLECGECGGNSHDKKGTMGRPMVKRPQEFIYGIKGLTRHLTNGHQVRLEGVDQDDIVELHGKPLEGTELQEVKNDRSGASIAKKRVQATGKKSRTKAARAKKGNVTDSATTDETEVGEGARKIKKSEEYVRDDEEDQGQEAAAAEEEAQMGGDEGESVSENGSSGFKDEESGWETLGEGEDESDGELDDEEGGELAGDMEGKVNVEVNGADDEEEYGVEPPPTPEWARESFHGTFGP